MSVIQSLDVWLLPDEIRFLFLAAQQVPRSEAIVEIGSWKGGSTAALALGSAAGEGAHVFAIDHHHGEHDIARHLGVPLADICSWCEFESNLRALHLEKAVTPILRDSLVAEANWNGAPIGLLWIDGGHDYEIVASDLAAWSRHVRPGGIIALHDTANMDGPRLAVEEAIAQGRLLHPARVDSITYGIAPEASQTALMEVKNPSVSIIIAAHNEGDNVRRTVESILAYTDAPDFEVVPIDDGSDDLSFSFLDDEPYRSDARLRRYRFEQSVGCIRARHQGVRLARGEYVAFLDAHITVHDGWLSSLVDAVERSGGCAAVTPNITSLNETTWSTDSPTGQMATINEKLDFVWVPERQAEINGQLATVLGCCMLMPRRFYFQIGGFDVGLRRWGCEFIDLILKVYAAGGACYYEPSVLVGHLFRSAFPYAMRYRDVTYNKLRTGYVHFPDEEFRCLFKRLAAEPGFAEAMEDFEKDLSELDQLRRAQRAANRRAPDWFVRTFLNGLYNQTDKPENGKGDAATMEKLTTVKRRVKCPQCGATNIGIQTNCLMCQASLPEEETPPPPPPTQERVCPNPACGKPLREGAKFCTHCGFLVGSTSTPTVTPTERRCPNPRCGKSVPAGKNFCTACGTRVT